LEHKLDELLEVNKKMFLIAEWKFIYCLYIA
jgi:hypothetical protein